MRDCALSISLLGLCKTVQLEGVDGSQNNTKHLSELMPEILRSCNCSLLKALGTLIRPWFSAPAPKRTPETALNLNSAQENLI